MEEIFVVHKNFEHENQTIRESITHLQTNQTSTSLRCVPRTQPQPKGTQINLPNKFDGTCSKFQSFLNQVCLVIQLHLHWYPTNLVQVGFIGTSLSSIALAWFARLLEH
jgi:hypothetical protein